MLRARGHGHRRPRRGPEPPPRVDAPLPRLLWRGRGRGRPHARLRDARRVLVRGPQGPRQGQVQARGAGPREPQARAGGPRQGRQGRQGRGRRAARADRRQPGPRRGELREARRAARRLHRRRRRAARRRERRRRRARGAAGAGGEEGAVRVRDGHREQRPRVEQPPAPRGRPQGPRPLQVPQRLQEEGAEAEGPRRIRQGAARGRAAAAGRGEIVALVVERSALGLPITCACLCLFAGWGEVPGLPHDLKVDLGLCESTYPCFARRR